MARVCEEECMGRCPGDEPLTLTRCHSCDLQQLYEALEGRYSVCDQGHKVENLFFISFSFTNLLILLISWHVACRHRGDGN